MEKIKTMQSRNRSHARFGDPLEILLRGVDKLYSMWLQTTYPFISTGRNLSVHFPCVISKTASRKIKLGSFVIIRKDAWLNVVCDGARESDEAQIIIDDNCSIGARSQLSANNLIHLEANVILSASVLIQDHHHSYQDISRPINAQGVTPGGRIRIEQGCWIGQGVAIICNKGELVIGRNSVVGANSVVTKSFPPYSVIVGSPGRLVKRYDPIQQGWVATPPAGDTKQHNTPPTDY